VQNWFDSFVAALAAARPGATKPATMPSPQPTPALTYQPGLPAALMS
jgi:hypothetical protein